MPRQQSYHHRNTLRCLFFFFFLIITRMRLRPWQDPWVPKVPSAQGQGRTTIYTIITLTKTKETVFVHHKQSHAQVRSRQQCKMGITNQLPTSWQPFCTRPLRRSNNSYSALVNTGEYNSELNNTNAHYARYIARLQVVHDTNQPIEITHEASGDIRQHGQSQTRRRVAPLATFTTATEPEPKPVCLCFKKWDLICFC